jgi:hypothetical protein
MDLHIHTPASSDYQQPEVSYLELLQYAERRSLDIIALTDHNTVRGYRQIIEEMTQLEWLEGAKRLTSEESYRLTEYRRLFQKMLILPGFEFTATFGFHILGVFHPNTNVRVLEHLLLDLNIPAEALDHGETNIGASADVLTAYEAIRDAGGIVSAAHANSSHGVAMKGMSFGGQTRIAYTQDEHLHALEVTDLDRKNQRNTARFFDGSKPEYPRRMRCIQGSDAHRLERDARNPKNLGLGERVTEIQLPELAFEYMLEVFAGNDFARTRPFQGSTVPYDYVLAARQEGPSIVQAFHESMSQKGGNLYAVVADVCALANTNGGTIYVGVSADAHTKPAGVPDIAKSVEILKGEIQRKITPPVEAKVDMLPTEGISVIRVDVPRGTETPYAIEDSKIYVRDDTETSLAVRDEIVQLVLRSQSASTESASGVADESSQAGQEAVSGQIADAPRTGVEIVATEKRNGVYYHHLRDLRNGNIVRNVTRSSARKLWHYAITQVEEQKIDAKKLKWQGDIAVAQTQSRSGESRYDLAQKVNGNLHIYFGVTEDGLQDSVHAAWRALLGIEDEE